MRQSGLRLVALGIAAAMALSACGDSTPMVPKPSTTAGGEVSTDDLLEDMSTALTSAMRDHATYHVDVKVASAGQALTGAGDVDMSMPDNPKLRMALSGVGLRLKLVVLDRFAYVNLGPLSDNQWVTADQASFAKRWGVDIGLLNPVESLMTSRDAVTGVLLNGEEDGLKHYELTLDPTKIPGSPTATTKAVTRDVWVDEGNLMHRMSMDITVAGRTGRIMLTLSNWGEPVSVEAPPASDIATMTGIR